MALIKDITGQVFGRLTVVERAWKDSRGEYRWTCKCECGNEIDVLGGNLRSGHTQSCGCLAKETNGMYRHGYSRKPEHQAWMTIVNRCTKPKFREYPKYGGKGIKVCERWIGSFDNFIADMGPRPSSGHFFSRKDQAGDFTPDNCEWKPPKARGKTNAKLLEFNGRSMTVAEWSAETGLSIQTIGQRLRQGWSVVDTLTKPTKISIELDGVTQTLQEWSKVSGIKCATLVSRFKKGLPPADILNPDMGAFVNGNPIHGHAKTGSRSPEYTSWYQMVARCTNPNAREFKDYGGRGIMICDRWRNSFEAFLEDMGPRPEGTSIDRYPDNDGNYEPGNCRWATQTQQNRNTRRNKIIEFQGNNITIAELAERTGMPYDSLYSRLNRGWPVDLAVSKPLSRFGRRYKTEGK